MEDLHDISKPPLPALIPTPSLPTSPHSSSSQSSPLSSPSQSPEGSNIRVISSDNIHDSDAVTQQLQKRMYSSLNAVFERAEEAEGGVGVSELRTFLDEDGHGEGGVTVLESLTCVRRVLDQMWWSGSQFLSSATEVLADASREVEWRRPFGEAGVLEFFLGVVATESVAQDVLLHSLRLIGNTCADTDENRQRVSSQSWFPSLIRQLRDSTLVYVAVPVIYNICVDYEPAQREAANSGIVNELVDLLANQQSSSSSLISYSCRIIDLVVSLPQGTQWSPENIVEVLLRLASDSETSFDDFLALVNSSVAHLHDIRFQNLVIQHRSVELLLSILVDSYSRYDGSASIIPPLNELAISPPTTSQESEEEKLLTPTRSTLIQILSDISALPEFPIAYPLESPLIGSLRLWLSVPQIQLKACACIMLGNLARSDDVCRTMVRDFRVFQPLIIILEESSDSQVLHAATGFLKNLAIMLENKPILGEAGIVVPLSRLWSMETLPQIQYAGASLIRQIVNGSYSNIQHLLASLSSDPDSPAHSKTYLSLLLSLERKSDQTPTKTEVARTVTAICRTLNSSNIDASSEDVKDTQLRLYTLHPDISRPLGVMVSQNTWPVIRSEGWFAFALMARTKEGAAAVNDTMTDLDVFRPLVETVTGRSFVGGSSEEDAALEEPQTPGDESQTEMMKRDRENALVLISELLRHKGDEMAIMRREVFEDLLQGRETIQFSYQELISRATGSEDSPSMYQTLGDE
ncbi:MAG: hypothetical protein M1827_005834 [Pycnora praestabilis]|nr:MAG: hypothetical protein M1827_005834 [Pycnora praestabilis]